MQDIKGLRGELQDLFESIKKDQIDLAKAKEMTNTAGKIISSCQTEMKYMELTKKNKKIDFLE